MEKLKLHTPDLTVANIERIAELFPNCVTEAKDEKGRIKRAIDFDLLRQELSPDLVEGPQERYRLDWPGKREALALANMPVALTLRPCREESVDFENTKNLYIEGDNLDALKLLQETYLGKVKMIYIDPPYNTGNDFIYGDDFTAEKDAYERGSGEKDKEGNRMMNEERWRQNTASNGRFHSDWLSMIYPRLKLARNLLADDGVIFVSVDDNEDSNLSKLCDEVFGSDNFLSKVIIQSNRRGQTYKEIAKCHEYLFVYYKSEASSVGELEKDSNSAPYKDAIGPFELWELRNRNPKFGKHNRPNLYYPLYVDPNSADHLGLCSVSLKGDDRHVIEVVPTNSTGSESCWRWGKEKTLTEGIKGSPPSVFGKQRRDGGWNIYEKARKGTTKAKSLWTDTDVISEQGTIQAGEIGMGGMLEFPKPLGLIRRCLQIGTDKNDIILDFFSGSATTAHAVMQLNAEDGGNRRHIMVQLPEPCDEKSEAFKAGYKTIAEIGKERIRRSGKKILQEWQAKHGSSPEHLNLNTENPDISPPDIGFRVLKIDSSNFCDITRTPDELEQQELALHTDHLKPDRTPEDLLFQVLVDWGVDLALPVVAETLHGKRVFFVDQNALAACFDSGLTDELVRSIAERKPLRVVFRDDGFGDDSTRINVEQIFKLLSPGTEVKAL